MPGVMRLYPLIASLIRAERIHRQARSISYRISGAKFPVLKDLDNFVFADTPVDEGQVRELATGTFLDAKRNASLSAEPIPIHNAHLAMSLENKGLLIRIFS